MDFHGFNRGSKPIGCIIKRSIDCKNNHIFCEIPTKKFQLFRDSLFRIINLTMTIN